MPETTTAPPPTTPGPTTASGAPPLDVPTLNEALSALLQDLERMKAASTLLEDAGEAARSAALTAGAAASAAASLSGPVGQLVGRVDAVDFPARLDSVDRQMSAAVAVTSGLTEKLTGVHAGVTAVHGSLKALEAPLGELNRGIADVHGAIRRLRVLALVSFGLVLALLVALLIR
jgi:hypothetical protein